MNQSCPPPLLASLSIVKVWPEAATVTEPSIPDATTIGSTRLITIRLGMLMVKDAVEVMEAVAVQEKVIAGGSGILKKGAM